MNRNKRNKTEIFLFRLNISLLVAALFIFFNAEAKKTKNKPKSKSNTTYSPIKNKSDSVTRKVTPIDILPTTTYKSSSSAKNGKAEDIIALAKKQLGMPYIYASAKPDNGGFDCSGFVYYIMTSFNYKVPRTSKDYMNYGTSISKENAQKGDVILFTGTDSNIRQGGHVGIVLEDYNGDITFIHSSSGKAKGVTISKLSEGYYTQRFLKVVRIF